MAFRILIAAICPIALPTARAAEKPDDLGARVLKYTEENVGKKVGDGECATLALKALEAAGAKTTLDFGVSGEKGDYEWGTLVEKYADAKPGDIIQFRDVKIVTKTVTALPGGGTRTSTATQAMGQHTAIISAVAGKGKFKVLEQNAGPASDDDKVRKTVRESDLDLSGKVEGKVRIYRPVKK
jgi:hypothetical protein